MCAILGWINRDKDILNEKDKFKKMLNLMESRGRDNTGYVFSSHVMLGHKRLAIIDPEKGNQPMSYLDYTIVYNGELYNTLEIRDLLISRGYIFETNCDTEVVLKGYACFKEKILDMLEGIYAFGIYNSSLDSLFLGRDRFGVKPLYYCFKDNNFIFASSIKSILKSEVVKPLLNKEKFAEIMALGPSSRMGSGIFVDVLELRPAHYLVYKDGEVSISRYWELSSQECLDSYDEAVNKVRQLVTDSIKRQMVSDVGVATLLSGGLDSSIITAVVASNMGDSLRTYSIDYEDNDKFFKKTAFTVSSDRQFIELMSEHFKTDHKYEVISQKEVVELLKEVLYARDYPGMIDIDCSLLWFSRKIRDEYKVILSGECADEIFGGYPWFYRDDLNERESFPWINNIMIRQGLLKKELRDEIDLSKVVDEEYKRTISELSLTDQQDKMKKLFYVNMTHFMTTLLVRKDRMTMRANLEARVPFADTKLIEYLWNLPFDYKYRDGMEKSLLRDAFEGILPSKVLHRKKNPYPKTHHPYFLDSVCNLLRERLENKDSILYKLFDISEIYKLLDSYDDGDLPWFGQLMNKPQLIAYLYQFDVWVEEYKIEFDFI